MESVVSSTTRWVTASPWQAHLERGGVTFHFGKRLERIRLDAPLDRVFELGFAGGETVDVSNGHFVCALPIEGIAPLLPRIEDADPAQRRLAELMADTPAPVGHMIGAQYALRDDAPLIHGHVAFAETDRALTAVSQRQFWTEVRPTMEDYFGVPGLRGVISAIASDSNTAVRDSTWPVHGRAARDCSEHEILREIWRQMRVNLPPGLLADETLDTPWLAAQLGRNVELQPFSNRSPLLVRSSYRRTKWGCKRAEAIRNSCFSSRIDTASAVRITSRATSTPRRKSRTR